MHLHPPFRALGSSLSSLKSTEILGPTECVSPDKTPSRLGSLGRFLARGVRCGS